MKALDKPQGARPKKGGAKASKQDIMRSKQEMLAALQRQAEENTRILERERAQAVAMGLPTEAISQHMGHVPQGPPGSTLDPHARGKPGKGNQHVFLGAPKKVFDPSQVPGLGGPLQQIEVKKGFGRPMEGSLQQQQPGLEGTFPDTPTFYPGMVFEVPAASSNYVGWSNYPSDNQPQHQQQPDPYYAQQQRSAHDQPQPQASTNTRAQSQSRDRPQSNSNKPPRAGKTSRQASQASRSQQQQLPPQPEMQPPPPPPQVRQSQAQWEMQQRLPPTIPEDQTARFPTMDNLMQQQRQADLMGMPYPQQPYPQQQPYTSGPSHTGASAATFGQQTQPEVFDKAAYERQQREARQAQQEQYRRELEEQVRLKQEAKQREREMRRQQEAEDMARAGEELPHWQPDARANRRGGGGEPLRDLNGMPVADLRGAQRQGQLGEPSPTGYPPGPPQQPPTSRHRLTLQVPNPAGASPGTMGMPGGYGAMQPGLPPQRGRDVSPPAYLPPGYLPGPVTEIPSPGAGSPGSNRKFMAALSELRPGPSDEQRRMRDAQREQLQRDLDEQIRQKREREARQRAEEERLRMKEEEELRAYYERLNAQKEAEVKAAREREQQETRAAAMPQEERITMGVAPQPLPRKGRSKVIVDASWLDKPAESSMGGAMPPGPSASTAMQGLPSVDHMTGGAGGPKYGRRSNSGRNELEEDVADLLAGVTVADAGAGLPRHSKDRSRSAGRRSHSHRASSGAPIMVDGEVPELLHKLQEEQARLREEFVRQAAAVEKLASEASRAVSERDQAWSELQRVRAMLEEPQDSLDTFVVRTHLVPKEVSTIPSASGLATPLEGRSVAAEPGAWGGLGGGELDDVQLDAVDQLMRQELGRVQRMGGRGADMAPRRRPAAYLMQQDQWVGGYPRQAAPPSMIPKPPGMAGVSPRGPGGGGSGGGAADPYPKSRYNSFFNLETAGVQAAAEHTRSRRPHLTVAKPASPPILRGDHMPSPDKRTRAPTQSAPAHGRREEASRVRPVVRKGRAAATSAGPHRSGYQSASPPEKVQGASSGGGAGPQPPESEPVAAVSGATDE